MEKAGTGTTDMITDCLAVGLPEPTFEQNGAHFVTTIWRDWLTDAVMNDLGLNERQKKGLTLCKEAGQLSNMDYRSSNRISDRTALRDINDLVSKGILRRIGETGHQAHYVIEPPSRHEPDIEKQ